MRKLVSVVMVLAMVVVSVIPVSATANVALSNEKATITVKASAQSNNRWIMPRGELEVRAGLAAEYGYQNDTQYIGEGQISALDCLVAMHLALYGDKFTVDTKDEYLAVGDGGYVTNAFALGSASMAFAINGFNPTDGNYEGEWGAMAYSVSQSVIKKNDYVEFFFYAELSGWGDYITWFEQDGVRISSVKARPSEKIRLTLMGYKYAWGSSYEPGSEKQGIKPLGGIQLVLLNEAGEETPVIGGSTNENGVASIEFEQEGKYILSAIKVEGLDYIFMPLLDVEIKDIEAATVPEDFENDLWLQFDEKALNIGDKALISPIRVPQILKNDVESEVDNPDYTYEIVEGDSIELEANKSNAPVNAIAVKPGIAIVKVSYEAKESFGKSYSACSKVNEAYIIFNVVQKKSQASISTDINVSSYDTIYFAEGDTTDFTFKASAENAKGLRVTCNGVALAGKDGSYTAKLENRKNIIGIEAADSKGNIASKYFTIDARKIEILKEEKEDGIHVSFKGITNPIYKLAGIYNPSWLSEEYDSKGTFVEYTGDEGVVKGYCDQWDLATNNTIVLKLDKPGTYKYTNGRIFSQWWGKELGAEKNVSDIAPALEMAGSTEGYFSKLPDFEVVIGGGNKDEKEIKVKKPTIKLKKLKAKKVKVSWKKQKGHSYKLVMSTKKNGKYKTVMKYKKTGSKVVKKLKARKYFFKLKARKIVDGEKYYSKYSEVKKIKL